MDVSVNISKFARLTRAPRVKRAYFQMFTEKSIEARALNARIWTCSLKHRLKHARLTRDPRVKRANLKTFTGTSIFTDDYWRPGCGIGHFSVSKTAWLDKLEPWSISQLEARRAMELSYGPYNNIVQSVCRLCNQWIIDSWYRIQNFWKCNSDTELRVQSYNFLHMNQVTL